MAELAITTSIFASLEFNVWKSNMRKFKLLRLLAPINKGITLSGFDLIWFSRKIIFLVINSFSGDVSNSDFKDNKFSTLNLYTVSLLIFNHWFSNYFNPFFKFLLNYDNTTPFNAPIETPVIKSMCGLVVFSFSNYLFKNPTCIAPCDPPPVKTITLHFVKFEIDSLIVLKIGLYSLINLRVL